MLITWWIDRTFLKARGLSFDIASNDMMIAGHVLSVEGTIVTNNQKHFRQVPKLKIENWALRS
jgi:predicted nucleic acid-binding protein